MGAAIRANWRMLAALAAVAAAAGVCLSLAWAGYARVELFHAAFVDGCSVRDYQIHWQDRQRYPNPFRWDFFGSPDTFALVVIWLDDGPALEFSQVFPARCSWP